MKEEIINIKNQCIAQLSSVKTEKDIESLRIAYLGRNGKLTKITKTLKNIKNIDEKKTTGILINQTKTTLQNLLATKLSELKNQNKKWIDETLPGIKPEIGHLHLVTQAIDEIATIFENIGFVRSRYPEVEYDWQAFGSLNFSDNHPARDEWETFFVDSKPHKKFGPMLLTPHTSSGQIREMKRVRSLPAGRQAPIRMINIAKCHRRQLDNTHLVMFHQFEGLVIDENINITHLKGTIDHFAKMFYGKGAVSRIRPYNFPFTEPSFEVDFSCVHCGGIGCKFCKGGWHEVGGAGMVHPNVLKNGRVDPKIYSGFAFGWGVERALALRPGANLDDIRTIYSTNLKILNQF